MTGVVIDDASREWTTDGSLLSEVGEQLGHVANLCRDRLRTGRPRRVVSEQLTVFLHRRTAARRVDDDLVDASLLEHFDVVSGERSGLLDAASMKRQRTAAALAHRCTH